VTDPVESWAALFERAPDGVTGADVRGACRDRREAATDEGAGAAGDEPTDATPARIVADADVLAADLLVGGATREALDRVREHSWLALLASDRLLADAEAVVAALSTPELAAPWRRLAEARLERIDQPAGDHPALATAYRGGAMHVLSLDDRLVGAEAGAALRGRFPVSVRRPAAFLAVFDAGSLHAETVGGDYPGPDRDPRG